jgi:glycosyltransferase involved in cell wall biosynthesis
VIHVIGLPHTPFDDKKASSCAFTAKAVRTVKMLRSFTDVTVYWGGPTGDVHLLSASEQSQFYGEWNPALLPQIKWDLAASDWKLFNRRSIEHLEQSLQDKDIIAFAGGGIHQPVIDHFAGRFTCVEYGVGYEGIARNTFACFESYAWMHNRYGAYGIGDGRAFDTVIPNVVIPDEWEVAPSDGYALFVGRLIQRKGPHVAAQIANAAGMKLLIAGAGVKEIAKNRITCEDGTVIEGDIEYVGVKVGDERRDLFAKAEVFICPTLYIGPWEGVHAEAMMSGVGVAAPDYGVFTETLPREYRYRNLTQAVSAVKKATETRGDDWRKRATEICGPEACTYLYEDWIHRLKSLRNGRNGWYDTLAV